MGGKYWVSTGKIKVDLPVHFLTSTSTKSFPKPQKLKPWNSFNALSNLLSNWHSWDMSETFYSQFLRLFLFCFKLNSNKRIWKKQFVPTKFCKLPTTLWQGENLCCTSRKRLFCLHFGTGDHVWAYFAKKGEIMRISLWSWYWYLSWFDS